MKYLCLVYLEEGASCTRCRIASARRAATASGRAASWSPPKRCNPCRPRRPVRVRNGKLSVIDGPFAETKEQLAGFYLIEARDLNDAIQIAGQIPPAREGSIEVRPVRQLNPV